MISVIAHEVTEAMTDPYGTTWYDAYGNENGGEIISIMFTSLHGI
jgi:hypothetical protein